MRKLRAFRRTPENPKEWARWIGDQDFDPLNQDVTSSDTTTIDISRGECTTLTLDRATTIAFSNPPASGKLGEICIKFVQTKARAAVSWPSGVTWEGGTAPTITVTDGAIDFVKLWTLDGGVTWLGVIWQDFS